MHPNFKKALPITSVLLILVISMYAYFHFFSQPKIEKANDALTETDTRYIIETKDGISLEIPRNLNVDIQLEGFQSGYTYYTITPKEKIDDLDNKITFSLFQKNTDTEYGLYEHYNGKLLFFGDGALDIYDVKESTMEGYRSIYTDAKFRYGEYPQFTYHLFDIVPSKGVSVASFGYLRNEENQNSDMDRAWASIQQSLIIPTDLLKKTYGDIHLPTE